MNLNKFKQTEKNNSDFAPIEISSYSHKMEFTSNYPDLYAPNVETEATSATINDRPLLKYWQELKRVIIPDLKPISNLQPFNFEVEPEKEEKKEKPDIINITNNYIQHSNRGVDHVMIVENRNRYSNNLRMEKMEKMERIEKIEKSEEELAKRSEKKKETDQQKSNALYYSAVAVGAVAIPTLSYYVGKNVNPYAAITDLNKQIKKLKKSDDLDFSTSIEIQETNEVRKSLEYHYRQDLYSMSAMIGSTAVLLGAGLLKSDIGLTFSLISGLASLSWSLFENQRYKYDSMNRDVETILKYAN